MASVNIELSMDSIVQLTAPVILRRSDSDGGDGNVHWNIFSAQKALPMPARKSVLLHMADPDVQDMYDTLPEPSEEGVNELDVCQKAMKKLDGQFGPQVNVPYQRHMFRQ